MRSIFFIVTMFFICLSLQAQTSQKIKDLESQRSELQQQIAESESLLSSTKKDVKSQLDNLALLTGQIAERKRYIETIERDMKTLRKSMPCNVSWMLCSANCPIKRTNISFLFSIFIGTSPSRKS